VTILPAAARVGRHCNRHGWLMSAVTRSLSDDSIMAVEFPSMRLPSGAQISQFASSFLRWPFGPVPRDLMPTSRSPFQGKSDCESYLLSPLHIVCITFNDSQNYRKATLNIWSTFFCDSELVFREWHCVGQRLGTCFPKCIRLSNLVHRHFLSEK
jgi:hypothetical protein